MKEISVKINGVDIIVQFKDVYTRKIDKEFNAILFQGVDFGIEKGDIKANPNSFQEANDYLVKSMTNLTEEQIMDLSVVDYNKILKTVNDIKTAPLEDKKVG